MVRRIRVSKDQLRYFPLVEMSRSQSGIWYSHISLKRVIPHYLSNSYLSVVHMPLFLQLRNWGVPMYQIQLWNVGAAFH